MRKAIAALLVLLIISMSAGAQSTTMPGKPGSVPGGKLYTEAEAEAAIDAAVDVAVAKEKEGREAIVADLRKSLEAAVERQKKAETISVIVGIGAAVLIPAAFIGGALAWGALSD